MKDFSKILKVGDPVILYRTSWGREIFHKNRNAVVHSITEKRGDIKIIDINRIVKVFDKYGYEKEKGESWQIVDVNKESLEKIKKQELRSKFEHLSNVIYSDKRRFENLSVEDMEKLCTIMNEAVKILWPGESYEIETN